MCVLVSFARVAERALRYVFICMCVEVVADVLVGARLSGLSIIIIGVQAPRRICSH